MLFDGTEKMNLAAYLEIDSHIKKKLPGKSRLKKEFDQMYYIGKNSISSLLKEKKDINNDMVKKIWDMKNDFNFFYRTSWSCFEIKNILSDLEKIMDDLLNGDKKGEIK